MTNKDHCVTRKPVSEPVPGHGCEFCRDDQSSRHSPGAARPASRARQPPGASGGSGGALLAPLGFPESRDKGIAGMLIQENFASLLDIYNISIFVQVTKTPLETCFVLVASFVPFQRTVTWMLAWPADCADGRGLLIFRAGGRKARLYL